MYRQGDVLLVPVAAIPKSTRRAKREGGRIILAHGEATGHAHAILDEGVDLLARGQARFISVGEGGATLSHEEHGPISLPPGNYQVVIQREYTPQGDQRVLD